MSNSGATVTKFGIIEGVSAEIADFVDVAIQNATKEFISQGGPSVVSGVPLYSNTQGKLVASSPYSMPNTLGVAGQVFTVDAGGNIVYGPGSDPFDQDLNTFNDVAFNSVTTANITGPTTVIKLNADSVDRLIIDDSKSALYSKNALSGPAGSLLELNNDNTFTLGGYFANNGIIECRPNSLAMYGNTATTAITMTDLDIITSLGVGGRIDREILDTTSQTFKDSSGVERLKIDSDVTVNGAYTLPTTVGAVGDIMTRTGASSTIWSPPAVPSYIESDDGTSVIECSNLGEIKLNADSVDRLIIDDSKSALYSKNALSGPAGSLLELNNDNTFTLGCYAANNGIIECRPNSLTIFGNTASTAITMADLEITTSLGSGLNGRIVREILDSTSQTFKAPNGVERLKIDSNVTVNGAYTLPTTAGVDGEVLTRATGTSTVWNRPQIYSIYSQIVDATVVNTVAETTIIGGGTPTSTLTVPPNFFTAGMAFRYTTGGLFRTSANNISVRFRLRNSGVLFDSGLLVFSNRVIPATPWNVEATFAYMGGTVMVTNFNFQYNAGNDARGFTSQNSNNTFNATISNTLNFTIQWGIASVDNTITTNFGIVQKIY